MPKAILDKLPDKAKDIYEAAWEQAIKDGRDEETAAKIAISAVKRAGYSKDKETGEWHKMHLVSMHITKAALGGDGVMRWAATTSKFETDDQGDELTPEFYSYAKAQVAAGKRPDPVLCVSHIDNGKPDDSWVPGNVTDFYIDGGLPKAKGIFRDTPLGKAAFQAVRDDYGKPDDEKTRISLGFYDEGSEPIRTQKADGSEIKGRRFLKGWIKHLALTRVPVVKETEITVMEGKAMAKTKQEDAASIVGAELAEELVRQDKAELDEGLVLKGEGDPDTDSPADQVQSGAAEGDAAPEKATIEIEDPRKAKSVSLDEFRDRIYSAWEAHFPDRPIEATLKESWVREVMDDAVIVRSNGELLRVPYVVDAETGEIQFGTPETVKEIRQFIPVTTPTVPSVTVPHVAVKPVVSPVERAEIEAEAGGRRNQILGILRQLGELLEAEWTVDTEVANAAALGSPGTNPPTTVERSGFVDPSQPPNHFVDPGPGSSQDKTESTNATIVSDEKAKTLSTRQPLTSESVEVAAFVDNWAMQVKATLLGEGDRREKYATLNQLLNTFGESVQALVKEGTPPSSRDLADVVADAVRAAVEPVQNQLAGVKAELDELRSKGVMLGEAPQAPKPQSLDSKARVISQIQSPLFGGPQLKPRTAKELAYLSTREGPGY